MHRFTCRKRHRSTTRRFCVAAKLALLSFLATLPPGLVLFGSELPEGSTTVSNPSPVLGQIISRTIFLNGVPVSSGSTLLERSLLETGEYPAVVHLQTGAVLELAEDSSAYFERMPSGDIRVTVLSGILFFGVGPEVKAVPSPNILILPDQPGSEPAKQAKREAFRRQPVGKAKQEERPDREALLQASVASFASGRYVFRNSMGEVIGRIDTEPTHVRTIVSAPTALILSTVPEEAPASPILRKKD